MKNIIITGASSGLGAALAERYAAKDVTLGLVGRSQERLAEIATKCRSAGADVIFSCIDVRENIKLVEWLKNFDNQHPVDIVIANAGITYAVNSSMPYEPRTAIRDIIDTNFIGVVSTINPILDGMVERGKGHVVVVGSLSAYRGIPLFPAYAASKAAVRNYYEAIRGPLSKKGVTVTICSPGFFETPMTRNLRQNNQMTLKYAADKIKIAIDKCKSEIIFPKSHYFGLILLRLLPAKIADKIIMKIIGMK